MMAQRDSFINGIGLTEANSLIHLLNNDDTDDDNQLHLVKHSAYYGENEFSKLLSSKASMSILSGNMWRSLRSLIYKVVIVYGYIRHRV